LFSKALLFKINICIAIVYFPLQVFVFMDGSSTAVYNFHVRHPCFVDRITSIGKKQSNTTFNICVAKRLFLRSLS